MSGGKSPLLHASAGTAFLCAMAGTDMPVAENQAAYQRPGGSGTFGTGRRLT